MKPIRLHKAVARELKDLGTAAAEELADLLAQLAIGESIGLPASRPMPVVENGAHELRIRDRAGNYRVFYFTKFEDAILVFHIFKKKTEQTPKAEIETAKKRLKEMLS
jgi:phage-related protein